jgi:hypothetical protein
MIKRGDTAAYGLVKAMATGDGVGGQRTIGMDDGAFTYSKQGDGLTPEMIETLDRIVDDIAAGRIVVPSQPTGEVLNLDPAQVLFEEGAAGLTREEIGLVFETLIFGEHGDEAASICSGESAAADLACATFSVGLIEEWRRTQ